MFKNIDRILLLFVGFLLVWSFVDPASATLFFDGVGKFLSRYVTEKDVVRVGSSMMVAFPFAIGIFVIGLAFALFFRETGWLGVILLTAVLVTILLSEFPFACKVSATITYVIDVPIMLRSGAKLDRAIEEIRG
jgi:ABC-type sulfate transport system permease subunit